MDIWDMPKLKKIFKEKSKHGLTNEQQVLDHS